MRLYINGPLPDGMDEVVRLAHREGHGFMNHLRSDWKYGAPGDYCAAFVEDQLVAGDLLDQEETRLAAFGAWVGDEVDAQAEYTSRFAPPVLHAYDRDGETVNRVQYNPLYAAVHRDVYRHGIIGLNYGGDPRPFLLRSQMSQNS